MIAKLGASSPEMQHQVRPRVHRRELLYGDVPPDPEHRELAALVEQGIVAKEGEVDARTQLTRIVRTTSPCLIALTMSIPVVT